MNCNNCKNKIDKKNKYCTYCGVKVKHQGIKNFISNLLIINLYLFIITTLTLIPIFFLGMIVAYIFQGINGEEIENSFILFSIKNSIGPLTIFLIAILIIILNILCIKKLRK